MLATGAGLTVDNVDFHDAIYRTDGTHMECLYAIGVPGFTLRNSSFRDCAVMDVFFTYGSWWSPLPPAYGNVTIENNVFAHPEMENNARLALLQPLHRLHRPERRGRSDERLGRPQQHVREPRVHRARPRQPTARAGSATSARGTARAGSPSATTSARAARRSTSGSIRPRAMRRATRRSGGRTPRHSTSAFWRALPPSTPAIPRTRPRPTAAASPGTAVRTPARTSSARRLPEGARLRRHAAPHQLGAAQAEDDLRPSAARLPGGEPAPRRRLHQRSRVRLRQAPAARPQAAARAVVRPHGGRPRHAAHPCREAWSGPLPRRPRRCQPGGYEDSRARAPAARSLTSLASFLERHPPVCVPECRGTHSGAEELDVQSDGSPMFGLDVETSAPH